MHNSRTFQTLQHSRTFQDRSRNSRPFKTVLSIDLNELMVFVTLVAKQHHVLTLRHADELFESKLVEDFTKTALVVWAHL